MNASLLLIDIELCPNGMAYPCRLDAQWTMRFVSQGCFALTGYAPEALVDNQQVSWNEITLEEDRLRVREDISWPEQEFSDLLIAGGGQL